MAITLYACVAHGPYIITLDDELVEMDLTAEAGTGGGAYTPYLLSSPFEAGDGFFSKFRRASQSVYVNGSVTVELTPHRDGLPTGATIERDLVPGDDPEVQAPFSKSGDTHQLKIELSDFDAPVELGKSRQWLVPRRSSR